MLQFMVIKIISNAPSNQQRGVAMQKRGMAPPSVWRWVSRIAECHIRTKSVAQRIWIRICNWSNGMGVFLLRRGLL